MRRSNERQRCVHRDQLLNRELPTVAKGDRNWRSILDVREGLVERIAWIRECDAIALTCDRPYEHGQQLVRPIATDDLLRIDPVPGT